MPQACRTSRPWRSNPSIIDCGTAAPPTTIRRSEERSHRPGSASSAARIAIHTVGTPAVIVTRSRLEQVEDALGVEVRAGENQAGAGEGGGVWKSPGVRMEHRDDREDGVPGGDVEGIREGRAETVQDRGAVRVGHSLGAAGGARRVAHGCRLPLVERRPGGRRPHRRSARHTRCPGGSLPEWLTTITCSKSRASRTGSKTPSEGLVDDDRPVLRVVDDVGELIGVQARVEGVDDGAHCRNPEIHREVLRLVPEQRRDAVSGPDAQVAEASGQAPGLLGDRRRRWCDAASGRDGARRSPGQGENGRRDRRPDPGSAGSRPCQAVHLDPSVVSPTSSRRDSSGLRGQVSARPRSGGPSAGGRLGARVGRWPPGTRNGQSDEFGHYHTGSFPGGIRGAGRFPPRAAGLSHRDGSTTAPDGPVLAREERALGRRCSRPRPDTGRRPCSRNGRRVDERPFAWVTVGTQRDATASRS